MWLEFTKMHGLGNDFVVVDAMSRRIELTADQIRRIADRHFGIGCDQLLMVEPARAGADFGYRIFNADGGEVEQCGNGARCFAHYVRSKGYTDKAEIRVDTLAGVITLVVEADGQVRVDMGEPRLAPNDIPLRAAAQATHYTLLVDGEHYTVGALSMGNPHAVLLVDDIKRAAVPTLGARIERHADFPQRVNVGFMQIVDREHIRLRVFERGAGETLACGTGACAAVVVGRLWGRLDTRVAVDLPGGALVVSWDGAGHAVYMTGPTATVFEGKINI